MTSSHYTDDLKSLHRLPKVNGYRRSKETIKETIKEQPIKLFNATHSMSESHLLTHLNGSRRSKEKFKENLKNNHKRILSTCE